MDAKYFVKNNGKEIQTIMGQIFISGSKEKKYYISNELMKELMWTCSKLNKDEEDHRVSMKWKTQPDLCLEATKELYNEIYGCGCYSISRVIRQGIKGKETIKFLNLSFNEAPNTDTLFFCMHKEEE